MINVSYDVRTADGTSLSRAYGLPTLDYTPQWHAPLADRVGLAVHHHWKAMAGASVASMLGGGLLTYRATHRPLLSVGAALGGALAGGLLTTLGLALTQHTHDAPPVEEGRAHPLPDHPRHREQLKVMTYNLHGLMGPVGYGSSKQDIDNIAAIVAREHPDVLLLQELDAWDFRSNFVDGVGELARRLHPTSAVAASPGVMASGGNQHVGVFTFHGFKVDDARDIIADDPFGHGPVRRLGGQVTDIKKYLFNTVLHKPIPTFWRTPSYSPRNALDTVVETPRGNAVRVLTGHFSGPNDDANFQDAQVAPLATRLDAWRGPTILGADFNVRSRTGAGSTERHLMGMAGLRDSFDAVGVRPGDPRRDSGPLSPSIADIDRIYTSAHFHVRDVHVVKEAHPASDHSPVVATMVIEPGHGR